MILIIRTDNPKAEAGLYQTDGKQIAHKKWQAHRELSETIHKTIKEILEASETKYEDITGIVYYEGPGSFTGLRIGASVANAIAYSNKISVSNQSSENWIQNGIKELAENKTGLALPKYGSEPHITAPKK